MSTNELDHILHTAILKEGATATLGSKREAELLRLRLYNRRSWHTRRGNETYNDLTFMVNERNGAWRVIALSGLEYTKLVIEPGVRL